jgi:peroxiredoxin
MSTSPLRRVAVLVLIAVVGLMVVVSVSQVAAPSRPASEGSAAPDFTLTAYGETPLGGSVFQLSRARGSIVLVNFWNAACAPCREQSTALESVWQGYQNRGVIVVGINSGDAEADALTFINELGLTYLVGPGSSASEQAYAVETLPETFLVDALGQLIWSKSGPVTLAELEGAIAPLLSH